MNEEGDRDCALHLMAVSTSVERLGVGMPMILEYIVVIFITLFLFLQDLVLYYVLYFILLYREWWLLDFTFTLASV